MLKPGPHRAASSHITAVTLVFIVAHMPSVSLATLSRAPMQAITTKETISPYSMAVPPKSHRPMRFSNFIIGIGTPPIRP